LGLFSCQKEVPIQESDYLTGAWSILVGNWNWTHSHHEYGWCDNDNYSEDLDSISEGDQYSIEFIEEGIVRFRKNQILIKESKTFHISIDDSSGNDIQFKLFLDSLNGTRCSGSGNTAEMNFIYFPFVEEWGCGLYENNFTKE
jgi:hypothetical protein